MSGRRVVPTDRHALRVRPVPAGADGTPEARVGAVGDHEIAGPHRLRVGAVLPRNERAPHQAAVDDRRHRLGSLPQLGAGLLGPLGDHRVEVVTGDHVAVGGEARYGRPLEVEGPTERDRPETDEAVVSGQSVGQAHVVELLDGPRGQPVAAGLLSGEPLLLDQQDVVPGFGQVPCPPQFLTELRQITAKHGIVLIFDEVITGFRCSTGGAQGYYKRVVKQYPA